MNVVIAGGGTGGHLYPAIAIARELLRDAGSSVLFVGTRGGIEFRVLPREGLPLACITAGKLKGMGAASIIRTIAALPLGVGQSIRILRERRPACVVGVGGYASGPIGIAALLLRVPLVIVEPNSYAGLANRQLGRFASRVVLCFPGTGAERFFPAERCVRLGPLVRKGIDGGERAQALAGLGLDPGRYTVFVMGGSGGAHAINQAMQEAARMLSGDAGLQMLHQTGDKDREQVEAAYREAGVAASVHAFIHDMAGAYAAADLVIARAGATTVAELAVLGKRAVLIPFPFAADNHQEYNARTLAGQGTAEVIIQKDLTPEKLAEAIRRHRSRADAGVGARMPTNAAEEIARICRSYDKKI